MKPIFYFSFMIIFSVEKEEARGRALKHILPACDRLVILFVEKEEARSRALKQFQISLKSTLEVTVEKEEARSRALKHTPCESHIITLVL